MSQKDAIEKFKQNWTEQDFKNVKKAIKKHFTFITFPTNEGNKTLFSYDQVDALMGFAYTSTGIYACEGICNGIDVLYKEDTRYKYEMFLVAKDGSVWAELWDKDENVLYIKL